ncbi:MAG: hypothetical protein ABS49_01710 [Erythrobacter sp. SCN 62-14]|nr:MAG: hypothetical protein ABS49_01710 [Erythrobacter sp. SCN 62-14]
MAQTSATLILIYNADGGWLNALGDMVHKLASPATYPCSLCALTYGAVAMRRQWRRFLTELGMPTLFLYRDEFRRDLDCSDIALPAILLAQEAGEPELLVSAAELNNLPDLDALIAMTRARLSACA